MPERFTVPFAVTIRGFGNEDVRNLAWHGPLPDGGDAAARAFERQQRGEVVMLVAEANHLPVGQVWVDLARKREQQIGLLWSLGVLACLQNLGIGRWLIAAAEQVIRENGLAIAELGVEKANVAAQRLYERLGYRVVGETVEEWAYTAPDGSSKRVIFDEWVMQKQLNQAENAIVLAEGER